MADSSNIASGALGTVDWYIDSSGVLHLGAGTLPDNTPSTTGYANDLISPWNTYASKIVSISFDEKIVAPSYIAGYFSKLPSCTSLVKPENVDASKITDASNLFYNSGFTEIDLSSWNLSSLTTAEATFSTNDNLTKVLFPEMPNLVEIQFLFYYDRKLKETNIDKLELPVLSQANYTFFNCSSLTTLDTSRWNMSGVDNVSHMFEGCSSLTSVDTSNWNANFVTMDTMFSGCSSLKSLDVSTWNVSKATSFNMLFANCSLLETLIGVDKWDTSKVTTFRNMFYQDTSLKYLDLSSFTVNDTAVTTDMLNGVKPYVLGLSSNVKLSPKDTDGNTTGFISSSLSTSDLNGYRYYKYIQGGNASNIPVKGQNIVRNSDFSKGFTGFVKNLGANGKGIVDIQKDTDGTNMVHIQYPDNATGIIGFYTFSHTYSNNNPTTTHEINKGDIYTAIARVKGKGNIYWFGYEDTKNLLYEYVDYPDWTWISRTAVSPSHDDSMELTINQGELYVKNFAIFHGSTAYPYIKAPEDIYSMSPTNVAGGADLIHIYKEGSTSRLTSYWVRTGTTIAKDTKGNILSSTPNQIYDISSKPYPLYYTIPPVFKGYRLVGTQSGSKPVGMLDPNNMNVTYLYEPILDPSVNDLTKTTAVVNQGIRSVSYTKGTTKVTKSPDVANTLNLDNIIKDSGRTSPNE